MRDTPSCTIIALFQVFVNYFFWGVFWGQRYRAETFATCETKAVFAAETRP